MHVSFADDLQLWITHICFYLLEACDILEIYLNLLHSGAVSGECQMFLKLKPVFFIVIYIYIF